MSAHPDPAVHAAELRDYVACTARWGYEQAAAVASQIGLPWYRCQSLAVAARHAPNDESFDRLIDAAFSAADETREPNRVVSVSAWPLAALLDRGRIDRLSTELDRLLQVISAEPHPVQRQDALIELVRVVPEMPDELLSKVLDAFRESCREGSEWKTDYNLRRMAELVNLRNHTVAVELALMSHSLRTKRRAVRAIGERELAERYYEDNDT